MKCNRLFLCRAVEGSHPARGAWIEISAVEASETSTVSHPARGAWIEIHPRRYCKKRRIVAPRKGCVD